MMRAVVYRQYGNPDVLRLEEVAKPVPKDHEVLVQIQSASVNSWDWDLLRGKPFVTRIGGIRKPKNAILGADIAGRVEAVGREVKRLRPGDEVFGDISGCGWGGFAEYVCAREDALSLKPANMTFEEAAALPQAGVLALQALRKGRIRKGLKVLINGAGGGVGTIAVQLAKLYDAQVTAVDKEEKLALLRSIGADDVVDYKQADFTRQGERYDLIVDVAGYRSIWDCQRALNPDGSYVMVGGDMTRIFQALLTSPLIKAAKKKRIAILLHKPTLSDQDSLKDFYLGGKVRPVIDRCYPLRDTAEALQYLGEGNARGKVMIRMDGGNP